VVRERYYLGKRTILASPQADVDNNGDAQRTAPPFPAPTSVDWNSVDHVDLGALVPLANGSEPHEVVLPVDDAAGLLEKGAADAARLLADTGRLVRSKELPWTFCLLVEGAGFHVKLDVRASNAWLSATAASPTLAHEICERARERFPAAERTLDPSIVPLRVWRGDGHGPSSFTKPAQFPDWETTAINYPGRTRAQLESLVSLGSEHLDDERGRIILFVGPPGVGKTAAIRSVMRAWQPWCDAELVMDPEVAFSDPEYLAELLTFQNRKPTGRTREPRYRMVVAEDTECLIQADGRGNNPGVGRLLGAADGLIGQGTRVLFLFSTNSDSAQLDPAIVRPGRCLSLVQFEKFSGAEARRWLGDEHREIGAETSLAELFELKANRQPLAHTGCESYPGYL
jgi:hypothetical protein